MSKKPKSPEKIDDSPDAMERQAKRRRARERNLEVAQREIKTERAAVLHSFLHRHGSAGLVILEGVSDEAVSSFREGFEIELDNRLLTIPAEGTIQGKSRDDEFARVTLGTIDDHRDAFGSMGVLSFEGVDFTGQSGRGTPKVAEHIAGILAATREKPRDELAVAAFGNGGIGDMTSSHLYDHSLDRGLVGQLQIVLALDQRGEPRTVLDPGIHSAFTTNPYRQ